jgi:hypothetical protein
MKIKIHKIIILSVLLFGCENWCLTLREKHIPRMIEHRVMRISGPDRDETIGSWRKMHNEELHNVYSSLNIITLQ